jgi:hypothetical protein
MSISFADVAFFVRKMQLSEEKEDFFSRRKRIFMEIWRVAEGIFFHFFSLVKKIIGDVPKGVEDCCDVSMFKNDPKRSHSLLQSGVISQIQIFRRSALAHMTVSYLYDFLE